MKRWRRTERFWPFFAAAMLVASTQSQAETADTWHPQDSELQQVSEVAPAPGPSPGQPPTGAGSASQSGAGEVHRTFWFSGRVDLSETYTTNARGVASGEHDEDKGDFVTRGRLDLGLHERTARFIADVNYALSADYYARTDTPTRISNNLTALARAEVVPEHLFLAGRAFAQPIYISRLGALAASDRQLPGDAASVIRDTYGFDVDPQFTFLLGDFARSTLSAAYGMVFFEQPNGASENVPLPPDVLTPPQDTRTWMVSEKLSSGPFFQRLHWDLLVMNQEQSRDVGDFKQRTGLADASYAVARDVFVLGRVGYQSFDSSPELTRNLDGVIAMGGVRFTAGPTFDASILVGRMFNATSFIGNLHFEMSPRMAINGTLTDTVSTPGQSLLDSLNNLAASSEGEFYNTSYQLSPQTVSTFSDFDPVPIASGSFDNTISRYRRASISFLYEGERTHVRAMAFGSIRDILTPVEPNIDTEQKIIGANLAVERDILRSLKGIVEAGYSIQDIFGGQNRILHARGELAYSVTPETFLYLRGAYVRRQSSHELTDITPAAGDLSDTEITIGIRRILF